MNQKEIARRVNSLVRTSCDDLYVSLQHVKGGEMMPVLESALALCQREGSKTKASHIQRRINWLRKRGWDK